MALLPIEGDEGGDSWIDRVTLVCHHCEVTWRGVPLEPCWLCGSPGKKPLGMTLVKDEQS
ncbi:MAG: hypothetical protein CL517_05680 [Actinobacteria bacterium]|nr:hypothetical protein [Actinomycetota bacterium]MEC7810116.1 hypothetical protein [Actinomycetota bacterium]MED5277108.1 hypothetical protein [Actinomycetota bacterium]